MSQLKKELTVSGLTMIAIGACIGSGIFTTPSEIIAGLSNYSLVLILWTVGGVITLLGSLVFSELSARYPSSGGVYVFLKEAYGDLFGFLYGWVMLFVINTGAVAALTMALIDYLSFFIDIAPNIKKILAICIILGLTLINVVGVNISQHFAKLFTGLKLLAIAFIIIVAFGWAHNIEVNKFTEMPAMSGGEMMSALLIGLVGVFWSYGGWHHATYLAGETINPKRNIPKAMILGTIVVTIVYLLSNLAYMSALPFDTLTNTDRIAGDAMESVFSFGGKLVTIFIAVSIFGTIGIYTMTAPRIYFKMAEDGLFFKQLAMVHPKLRTPYIAMIAQALWACILVLIWGSFAKLITFVTFMDIVFMCLAGASIFVFRYRKITTSGFKVPWYPAIPILYTIVTAAFVVNTLFTLREESFAGLAILLSGIPVFLWFRSRRDASSVIDKR